MFDYADDVSRPAPPTRPPATLGVEPVGQAEIAERLRARPQTVAQWHYRGQLPPPRWTVGGRPAWNWPDVERWARATGKLVDKKAPGKSRTSGAKRQGDTKR